MAPYTRSSTSPAGALLGAVALALSPLLVHAAPAAELRGSITGGASGSSALAYGSSIQPATTSSHIAKSQSDIGADGSYAHGIVDVQFGTLRAFSDAHQTIFQGAPQATSTSEFIDYIQPWQSSAVGFTNYVLTITTTGSHTPTDPFGPYPGFTAQAQVAYGIVDNETGTIFARGYFDSTDASPAPLLTANVSIAPSDATHYLRIDVYIQTFAYVSNANPDLLFSTAVVDYSHTVLTHLDALTPGASTMGVSGFNYATAVPEPSMSTLMGFGLGVLAVWQRRRRRSAMPA